MIYVQRLQLWLSFIMAVSLSLFLLSCSAWPAASACSQRQTYGYRFVDLSGKIHYNVPLTLTWKAMPDPSPTACQAIPSKISIHAKLYGPYRSFAGGRPPTQGTTVAEVSLQTDVWTNKTYTQVVPPDKLLPGAYVLVHSETIVNSGNTQADAIIQVVN